MSTNTVSSEQSFDLRARALAALPSLGRWSLAIGGALLAFSALLAANGVNPADAYVSMWSSTFARPESLEQILIRMAPLTLAALAVAVPARAGLTNVGGQGQLIVGGIGACGMSLALGTSVTGPVATVLMVVAAIVAGAGWAAIAAAMRLFAGVNEAISTLLLNFVALDLLLFLIYQPWRASATGQPATVELTDLSKLPVLAGTTVNVGIVLAVVLAVAVHYLLRKTRWGFRISVAGGNSEAARRAGYRVGLLVASAILIGGALAGLAGMIQFSGVEYKLRPSFGGQLGYTAFLACWLARHQPLPILASTFVFAALSVSADSLQLDSGVPAASVNILTAMILIAVLGFAQARKKARS
jgi:general nucleoside transport system permease protein